MGSKKRAPAPAPDPRIGESAVMSAQLGKEWLDFAKDQHAAGNIRQDQYDKLIKQVVDADLATQQQAKQWATDDRAAGQAAKDRFDQFGAEAERLGTLYGDQADQLGARYGDRAENIGDTYGGKLDNIARNFGRTADSQTAFGDSQRGRYGSTFAPIEDRFAKDAMEWDSDARLTTEAGKARADVLAEAQRQNDARTRSMAAMGVNPNSGRFAGISRADDISAALGAAGAANVARDNVRAQGIQLRGQASQLGQQVLGSGQQATALGLQARQAQQGATQAAGATKSAGVAQALQARSSGLAQAQNARFAGLSQAQQARTGGLAALGIGNTSANTSLNAGSSAVSAGGAGNAAFNANNAAMGQGFSGAMSGYGQQGQILGNLYGNQLNAWSAQNAANAQSSAGFGSMIGQGIGAYAAL